MKDNHLFLSSSLLIGFLFFLLCGGLNTLNVTNVSFLMKGDPAQSWIGWEFFRHTPLLQWPLGSNTNYGESINNSIIYTDSIPLLALAFKPIDFILPDQFQYTGIWILSCCMLQALFSFLLLRRLGCSNVYSLIACTFFLFASPFIFRMDRHFALSAQWMLLAGLYFYLNNYFRARAWIAILIVASLTHAYLLVMCLAIWFADLVSRALRKELRPLKFVFLASLTISLIGFVMYSSGYFMISGDTGSDGFGFYKMNLNSPINPLNPLGQTYSNILPQLTQSSKGDIEGINYFGAGSLLAIGLSSILLMVHRKDSINLIKNNIILILVMSLLFIFSLSNIISLGSNTIITYTLPTFTDKLTSTFRATGRFFWPVYYGILTFSLWIVSKYLNRKSSLIFIFTLVILQGYDLWSAVKYKRSVFNPEITWTSPLNTKLWDEIAYGKQRIVAIPAQDFYDYWLIIGEFASTRNLSMNFGYFARFNREKYSTDNSVAYNGVMGGNLKENTIYIFKDKALSKKSIDNCKCNASEFSDVGLSIIIVNHDN